MPPSWRCCCVALPSSRDVRFYLKTAPPQLPSRLMPDIPPWPRTRLDTLWRLRAFPGAGQALARLSSSSGSDAGCRGVPLVTHWRSYSSRYSSGPGYGRGSRYHALVLPGSLTRTLIARSHRRGCGWPGGNVNQPGWGPAGLGLRAAVILLAVAGAASLARIVGSLLALRSPLIAAIWATTANKLRPAWGQRSRHPGGTVAAMASCKMRPLRHHRNTSGVGVCGHLPLEYFADPLTCTPAFASVAFWPAHRLPVPAPRTRHPAHLPEAWIHRAGSSPRLRTGSSTKTLRQPGQWPQRPWKRLLNHMPFWASRASTTAQPPLRVLPGRRPHDLPGAISVRKTRRETANGKSHRRPEVATRPCESTAMVPEFADFVGSDGVGAALHCPHRAASRYAVAEGDHDAPIDHPLANSRPYGISGKRATSPLRR